MVRSFGCHLHLSKSMDNGSNYRDIVPDTYNTSNLWGPSEYDTRHIVMFNYIYDLPFFKNAHDHHRQAAGRLGNRRHRAVPDRRALRHRHQQRFRRRGRVRQLRLRFARPVLEPQRSVQINTGAFAGPVTNRLRRSTSPPTFRSRRRDLQPAVGCPRLGLPARFPGLEPRPVEDFHHQRTERLGVPRRSLRLHQPCQSERSEPESHFQPVRHDYQQNGIVAQSATFPALQLLTAEPIAA